MREFLITCLSLWFLWCEIRMPGSEYYGTPSLIQAPWGTAYRSQRECEELALEMAGALNALYSRPGGATIVLTCLQRLKDMGELT